MNQLCLYQMTTSEVQFHKINFLPKNMLKKLSVIRHINNVKKTESMCLIKPCHLLPCKDTMCWMLRMIDKKWRRAIIHWDFNEALDSIHMTYLSMNQKICFTHNLSFQYNLPVYFSLENEEGLKFTLY